MSFGCVSMLCVCVCYEACCVHKRRCTKVVVMSWGGVVFKVGATITIAPKQPFTHLLSVVTVFKGLGK